ncbi:MAG: hypothetical protein WCE75_06475 [Terracidiphilus sp.]
MRKILVLVLVLFGAALSAAAEEGDAHQTEATYIVRTGQRLQPPLNGSYRLLEFTQQRGRWIFPDVGYYDIGNVNEQLWFAGAGAEVYRGKHLLWTQIVYVEQEAGKAAHNERAMWIWPVLDMNFSPRLSGQAVFYPTIPLTHAQRAGFDVDRVKVEYAFRHNILAGVGYAATVSAGSSWQNRPFVTFTNIRRSGKWEFWIQRIAGGAQLQARYQLDRHGAF